MKQTVLRRIAKRQRFALTSCEMRSDLRCSNAQLREPSQGRGIPDHRPPPQRPLTHPAPRPRKKPTMPPTPTPKPFLPGHYDTPIYRPLPDGDPARVPMAWPDLVTWIERTYSALPDPEADLDDLRTTGRSRRVSKSCT